ncbi:hypothetical protein Gpo141_00013504 [Globisporangium polare]
MATLLRHYATAPPLTGASGVCVDRYAERVLIPRVALLSLLSGITILSTLVARRLCCRSRAQDARSYSQVKQEDEPEDEEPMVSVQKETTGSGVKKQRQQLTGQNTHLRRCVVALLGVGMVWTSIFLLSLQSYEFGTSSGGGGGTSFSSSRPRVVFSFTTIDEGITKLQPTLDALVAQDGEGFDVIYVVVPRIYRKTPIEIPPWLVADVHALNRSDFHGITFATGASAYHEKVHIILLDTDFGPASKVLGTLLVENDPETIIVYGDDDRVYPPQLCERALHYTSKYLNEAIAVLGGWISAEDSLYCGRSLEVGVNSVSFVGGAGGVAVKRKFFGIGEASLPAFEIAKMSKACFLGDDYYLSHLLSNNGVPRRLVYDSCWNIENLRASYPHGGLSYAESQHPGGANVEHYQQCIRELGFDRDLSGDGEFGWAFMNLFAHTWGAVRGLSSWIGGSGFVAC